MIHLAIDEMQDAESRKQSEAGGMSWLKPHAASGILHPAPSQAQILREETEERLKQAHLQAGHE